MIVESDTVRFDSISLDNGATLAPVEVAYETYGKLNAAKSNAILVLHAFSGGSMGGMQALEWAVAYPDRVVSAIPVAATTRHSAQQIAFNEVGRQAVMADPDWNGGDYYGKQPPARGLAVARMVGHITY